ncbi:MAG: acyltransferase [Proteobacteria bacterium]|nr:acyltransferase [Pseudomonadota bacterium]
MQLLTDLKTLLHALQTEKRDAWRRRVPIGDLLTDRKENAAQLGWGEGTTCYDNVLVLGEVRVGKNTWIGPNVILDGSGGGLEIGDNCSISAGVQIYTHDTVAWATSGGKELPAKAPTKIGSNCYIGPSSIVSKGVTIGDCCIIGALSFVRSDVPSHAKAVGCPARIVQPAEEYLEPTL